MILLDDLNGIPRWWFGRWCRRLPGRCLGKYPAPVYFPCSRGGGVQYNNRAQQIRAKLKVQAILPLSLRKASIVFQPHIAHFHLHHHQRQHQHHIPKPNHLKSSFLFLLSITWWDPHYFAFHFPHSFGWTHYFFLFHNYGGFPISKTVATHKPTLQKQAI